MLCVSFAYLGAGVIVHCLLVDAVSFGNLTDGESISAQSFYLFDLLNGELATRVCSHLSQSGKRVQDVAHCGGAVMNEDGDLICRDALPSILADQLFLILFQTRREWHIINPFCIIIHFCANCTTILTEGSTDRTCSALCRTSPASTLCCSSERPTSLCQASCQP